MDLSLGVRALLNEMQRLAVARGFEHARVDSKVNGRGELVLALLIPPRTPQEWGPPAVSAADREAKRLERGRRS
jgi:hypothetical protein